MRWVLVVVTVVTLLVWRPALADGPVIGPGPCSSDTPWGCFPHRVWLPVVMAE